MTLSKKKFHEYLTFQIGVSPKTQKTIAEEIGYDKPNIITMFKQGLTRVPIERIPRFAKALGVDPAYMLRMAMQEYMPEVWATIEGVLGTPVSQNERKILDKIREFTQNQDPMMQFANQVEALEAFCKTLTEKSPH
jgi:transcriptional regulator with XRE-family HTH domain